MAIAATERRALRGRTGLLLALCCQAGAAAEPSPSPFPGIWTDAPGLHRLVLVDAPAGYLQAVLYGTLADGRRYVVSAGSVREADDGLWLDWPAPAAYRGPVAGADALAGHRAELPPVAGLAPGPSRWQAVRAAGGLRLRCLHGCAGWPAELHLTPTPAGR